MIFNPSDWDSCKNILCIRPDNIGDVLMTVPAIRALKRAVPGRKITLLSSGIGRSIAGLVPEIDHCITFDAPWYKHEDTRSFEDIKNVIKEIASFGFDGAVIFTVMTQSPLPTAMLCYMAGIPKIAGYCRENPYNLITHWVVDNEPLFSIKHEVVRQLHLVECLGVETNDDSLSISLPQEYLDRLPAKLQCLGIDLRMPWLILHAGASEIKRLYPAKLYAEAVRQIARDLGYQVLLTGVSAEKEMLESIAGFAGEGVYSLAGMLTLHELVALIKMSPLLISNNTGPVHIAAAVKTPVIVLYALSNPQHTPWKVRHKILYFDIPPELRSKNSLVRFAYENSFMEQMNSMVKPEDIFNAVIDMLSDDVQEFSMLTANSVLPI